MEREQCAETEHDYGGIKIVGGEIEIPPVEVPEVTHAVATYAADGPRLMITHIVNENFKSYAGVQTLGPFHKCFSAIVGPNGSGKSNVIDSMLFVFGYRANKIRSKKISVLIHNSEDHLGLTSCSVAVHFQKILDTGSGEDDYDVIPNSKFSVSRTAFKDNSSYYKINDKKATYKEVATLLRGKGIDLDHNRFLILQGEVEQIAMMKPKAQTEHDEGMLEFLEDIIGSSRFKDPIVTLNKRVEALNDMRGEKLNRVKVVEKEKDDLEGAKNEAVEYLTLENEIVKKKNVMFSKYIMECAENQQKAIKKRDEIAEGMKGVTDKLNELEEKKKTIGKEHKKIYKEYEQLSKLCEETREKFTTFEQQDVRCREDLKHSITKRKKLGKTLEQEKKKLEDLKLLPEKMKKEVENLEKRREKLEKDKEKEEGKLAEVMESLKTETAGLQEEKEGKERELDELQKAVNETKSVMSVAQSEHELFLKNLNSEKSKLAETERNLNKASETLKERQSSVKDLEKKIPAAENALSKAKKDLEEAAAAEAKLSEKVRVARVKVEEARSSQQAASHKGKVIDALMQLKKAGKMPGIHGRLGDLGAIDEKYDVAISTACGPLDDIVVDKIDTAQKCVEFLKQNRVGRACFIGLDKQQRWLEQTRRKINTPENVPRLFDLIKVKDESVLPAFYFALRDTLVAKDLDQATRIAYGKTRYRVVTLGGQLIDQSGTMSGGGGRVSKGRMGSMLVDEIDPKVLQKMEETLQKDSSEAQNCRQNMFQLRETVDRLKKSLHEMKHTLEKSHLEIQSLTEQVSSLSAQKKEQEQRVKAAAPDEKTLKDLEKKVNGHRKNYEKARDVASKKEEEVHKLHKQIMDIGGSKLSAAETRVNMVSKDIDKITGEITKANVSIKSSHRNFKNTTEKVRNIEEEVEECKTNVEKLESESKDLEAQATSVLESYSVAQEKMKKAEHELNEVRSAMGGIEEQEQTLQKENIEIKHELEKYEVVVKENQSKLKHWKKASAKLELHKIERDDVEKLPEIPAETLSNVDTDDISYEITMLEERLAKMKPNMTAIEEYRKKEEQYLKRVSELDKITELRDGQRKQHEDLRTKRQEEFMLGFSTITGKLKEMYQMITLGGDAELELVDSLDPFSEGVVFSVRPPKKSWKNISNLSGGEKTLSSLALVFALHHYKPTPLYVMDEIDAALDFKNVSIVANYIKERTKNAQFIIISLRNNMFELADRLIGIYKTHNCTKSVTINPAKISLTTETGGASTTNTMTTTSSSSLSAPDNSTTLPEKDASVA